MPLSEPERRPLVAFSAPSIGLAGRKKPSEGASADPAAVHWAENLDVPDRVEPPRYPCLDQFDDARHGGLRFLCLHEVEVAVGAG